MHCRNCGAWDETPWLCRDCWRIAVITSMVETLFAGLGAASGWLMGWL